MSKSHKPKSHGRKRPVRKAARAPKSKLASQPRTPPADVIAAAQQTERETGVPTSATLGQWALESGFGKHTPGNNPFGIKARPGQPYQLLWTHEKAAHSSKLVRVQQKFRKFDSLEEAFRARGELLSKRYPLAMAHKDDPDAFVRGLQADPHHQYATDPNYAKLVTDTMHRNNFAQYDLKNAGKPSASGAGVQIQDGEPTVMLGSKQLMAAHVESPHTGGGKLAEGSSTVFVGRKLRPFSRQGDLTNDGLEVKHDVQDDVLIGD
ncbi:MAG TPA: glucosaminidase domain-containing protein [Polyangiaceae bacterium]|nr:glucosaminidase domain-containing protein [Polyangiaceae bacterium]